LGGGATLNGGAASPNGRTTGVPRAREIRPSIEGTDLRDTARPAEVASYEHLAAVACRGAENPTGRYHSARRNRRLARALRGVELGGRLDGVPLRSGRNSRLVAVTADRHAGRHGRG